MVRFLEVLNPLNSCFTTTDFDDALIDINVILKNIESASKNKTENLLTYNEKKVLLDNAFHLAILCLKADGKQKPDKQLALSLADILRQYATLSYDENYFAAKQILVAAFNLHLYNIGIFNECINLHDFISLDDLQKQCETKTDLFYSMEQSILSTSMDRCMTLAYTDSFARPSSKKKLLDFAETARWLGRCYQNIDQTLTINTENNLRFSQLFGLSESLLLFIDNDESKLALADLYLHAWPFMHERNHPLDIKGICCNYDKALHYDQSEEMKARIANGQYLTLISNGQKTEALPLLKKAIGLAEALEDNDKNRFFLSSLYANYASYLMEPETLDLKEAEINLAKACYYAADCRNNARDHVQFALYDIQLAELKFVKGEFKEAKESIERALATFQKQPKIQGANYLKAEAMKSVIIKSLG